MNRRALLSALTTGAFAFAGCLADSDGVPAGSTTDDTNSATPTGTHSATPTDTQDVTPTDTPDVPDECPKTRGFDVDWPDLHSASAVESFVETYENRYYREDVVEFENESGIDSYELTAWVHASRRVGEASYELDVKGEGGVYTPTLLMEATVADPPADAAVVSVGAVDDDALRTTLREAADDGEATLHVTDTGAPVARYLDLLGAVSDSFGPFTEPGDSDTLFVEVDERTVELAVTATRLHGDHWWRAWYYVDEHVVRRTTSESADPRNGTLLECRTTE